MNLLIITTLFVSYGAQGPTIALAQEERLVQLRRGLGEPPAAVLPVRRRVVRPPVHKGRHEPPQPERLLPVEARQALEAPVHGVEGRLGLGELLRGDGRAVREGRRVHEVRGPGDGELAVEPLAVVGVAVRRIIVQNPKGVFAFPRTILLKFDGKSTTKMYEKNAFHLSLIHI